MRQFYKLDKEKYSELIMNVIEYADKMYDSIMRHEIDELLTYSFSDINKVEILKIYFQKNIDKYHKLDNIYKIAFEGQQFKLEDHDNSDLFYECYKLDVFEKELFEMDSEYMNGLYNIVKYIECELNAPFKELKDRFKHEVNVSQLVDLESVIYETHLSNKKKDLSIMCLEEIHNWENGLPVLDYFEILQGDSKIYLSSLFIDSKDYNIIANRLIDNKVVEVNNNKFSFYPLEKGIALKKAICSLGYVLKQARYLNTENNTKIATALGNTFDEKISKQLFDASYKSFECKGDKASDYLALFYFIDKKV